MNRREALRALRDRTSFLSYVSTDVFDSYILDRYLNQLRYSVPDLSDRDLTTRRDNGIIDCSQRYDFVANCCDGVYQVEVGRMNVKPRGILVYGATYLLALKITGPDFVSSIVIEVISVKIGSRGQIAAEVCRNVGCTRDKTLWVINLENLKGYDFAGNHIRTIDYISSMKCSDGFICTKSNGVLLDKSDGFISVKPVVDESQGFVIPGFADIPLDRVTALAVRCDDTLLVFRQGRLININTNGEIINTIEVSGHIDRMICDASDRVVVERSNSNYAAYYIEVGDQIPNYGRTIEILPLKNSSLGRSRIRIRVNELGMTGTRVKLIGINQSGSISVMLEEKDEKPVVYYYR